MQKKKKKIEKNNRMGKTRDLFKNIINNKGNFLQRWVQKRPETV